MLDPAPQIRASHAMFSTALGWIGIAWRECAVTGLQLPDRNRATTERRLRINWPDSTETAPSAPIVPVIEAIKRYGDGEAVDFSGVSVDLSGVDEFRRAIYRAARKLGYGQTATYGQLAAQAGHEGLARETGQALAKNPIAIIIPCHRILAAGGKIGGFSAHGGAIAKERLLALEGVRVGPPPPAQSSFGF